LNKGRKSVVHQQLVLFEREEEQGLTEESRLSGAMGVEKEDEDSGHRS
jgi:hypothetical protein